MDNIYWIHTLLWLHDDNPRLSVSAQSTILDASNDLQVSMASFWEITIKKALGKLVLGYSLRQLYEACVTGNIVVVPIQLSNLVKLESLDFHHKDPFDRLIVATAIDMGIPIISVDPNIAKYPVEVIW